MIVIIAKDDDEHAVAVHRLLETEHQEQVQILNTSCFPTTARLNARLCNGSPRVALRQENGELDLRNVKSFWWRRPQPFTLDARMTDITMRQFTYSECLTALHGTLSTCGGLWVNDIHRDDAADFKPRQLEIARLSGLRVPETLISNDPQAAMAFWNEHGGNVVYKAFNQRAIAWRPARRLVADDLQWVASVAYSPVIFQRTVPGTRDLRITVVGKEIFAAEFVLPEGGAIDCRLHLGTAPCVPHTLPLSVAEKIDVFMTDLGLEYGAIDMRLTPDNEYVFFEVNTGGEFLYVQHRTQQPIAQALAAHLARGTPTRPARSARQEVKPC
jgi:glutathione synthase/RimK-type ligase-like ATP-grasp enzyme